MQKWEYCYLGFHSDDLTAINQLGAEGWEMVSFTSYDVGCFEAVFKRPLP